MPCDTMATTGFSGVVEVDGGDVVVAVAGTLGGVPGRRGMMQRLMKDSARALIDAGVSICRNSSSSSSSSSCAASPSIGFVGVPSGAAVDDSTVVIFTSACVASTVGLALSTATVDIDAVETLPSGALGIAVFVDSPSTSSSSSSRAFRFFVSPGDVSATERFRFF
ncbi:hypothetical protein ABW21_db0207948 [Orbilia brochopaga]|nr:hypothetical protein ABW21_db0207948 [Drechslerella brochopaga]